MFDFNSLLVLKKICDKLNIFLHFQDINDEELCLELLCLSGITRPGRFVALKNPTLTVFQDGEFGFRTNETGSVHYIDVDGDYFSNAFIFFVTIMCVLIFIFCKML